MPSSRRARDYCTRGETENSAADASIDTQSAMGTNAFGKVVSSSLRVARRVATVAAIHSTGFVSFGGIRPHMSGAA